MIFAIATIDSVLVYSTNSLSPLAIAGNIHYALLTDIAFLNSSIIGISSSDGYCSFIIDEDKSFGEPLEEDSVEDPALKEIMFKCPYYEKEKLFNSIKGVVL
jgi:chromatin assembly factor 1 subunit B